TASETPESAWTPPKCLATSRSSRYGDASGALMLETLEPWNSSQIEALCRSVNLRQVPGSAHTVRSERARPARMPSTRTRFVRFELTRPRENLANPVQSANQVRLLNRGREFRAASSQATPP